VGLRVLLPNLHSNAATKPGFMASVDTEKLLLGIYEHAGATSAVIMGKSWGGGEAVAFAAAHPMMVRMLVLVAPSLTDTSLIARIARLPAVLFWARDDPVRSFGLSQLYVDGMADVVLHAVPHGGHQVLDEYLPTLCTAASDALWAPPKRLHRATHVGRFVRVEPLEADRHCDELFAAFQDDPSHSRWAYSFQSGFSSREALWAYLASLEAGTGAYFGV
jgi:pimeloyl-ACP methyl ester carboxylesterase